MGCYDSAVCISTLRHLSLTVMWFYLVYFSFFHQVAHDLPAPDCEAFVQLGSSTTCDITEAVSLIKQAENMYVSSSNAQVSDAWEKQIGFPVKEHCSFN